MSDLFWHVQVWCEGAHTLQPARGAVAVFPRLSRAADAHQVAVVIPPVVTVIHQAVQVLAAGADFTGSG